MAGSAAARPKDPAPVRLRTTDVRNLALEGGGGKGFAYLGALEVLETLGVTTQVRSYAGASAGAISALLLSIGYTSADLATFLDTTDFASFFDTPTERRRPVIGGCEPVEDTADERDLVHRLESLPGRLDLLQRLTHVAGGAIPLPVQILNNYLWEKREEVTRWLRDNAKEPPLSTLLAHWPKYVAYLGRDMGLFSGCAARAVFEKAIHDRIRKGHRTGHRNMTFAEHKAYFGTDLLITGTNLSLGRTELFSARHTPAFPVADAVRISMSLPYLYKPYVIDKAVKGYPPCGTYVDGGLWNNLPFREFDSVPPAPRGARSAAARGSAAHRPSTLGLRLELTPAVSVRDFGALLRRVGTFALYGTGETQVLSRYVDQMILLDTRGLTTENFTPDKADRDRAVKRARRATWRYFGRPVPKKDLDPDDDAATERLRASDRACS